MGKGYIDTEFLKMLCEERIAAATQGETNTLNVLLVRRAVDEEETWQINVVFSAIPHVQADFIERATDAGRISEISQSEKFVLVETDLAHIAFGKDEIVGLPLFLYIDRKISNSKHLSKQLRATRWSGNNGLDEFLRVVEPVFQGSDNRPKVLAKNDHAARPFLRECDQMLLSALGSAQFGNSVQALGVPLKEWLDL